MKSFFDSDTAGLTVAEHLILGDFRKNYAHNPESKVLIKTINSLNPQLIIKLADADPDFNTYCHQDQFHARWNYLWETYGVLLKSNQEPFISYPAISPFDRLRGVHFFHISRGLAENNKDFTALELRFLKKALKYKSIHALQRYSQYIYRQIDSKMDEAEVKKLGKELIEIIAIGKELTTNYGSFAYLMLAEACYRCSLLHIGIKNINEAQEFYNTALLSCDYAESILKESEASINNASLGLGLQCSNTLKISSPQLAREYIQEMIGKFFAQAPEEFLHKNMLRI